jgi:uncharacterized protein YdhG (YjbR/CyaY superfamily)
VATSVDEYISGYPDDVQAVLRRIRQVLHDVVPGAGDKISYQMPTITMDGQSLVYFAAWKKHIGMYPIPVRDDDLEREIAPYRAATDTVRFPFSQEIPYGLIGRIGALLVEMRQAERPG